MDEIVGPAKKGTPPEWSTGTITITYPFLHRDVEYHVREATYSVASHDSPTMYHCQFCGAYEETLQITAEQFDVSGIPRNLTMTACRDCAKQRGYIALKV